MIKSRLTFILVIPTLLFMIASVGLLFIVYFMIKTNSSDLLRLDLIGMMLFLTVIAILPLGMLATLVKKFVLHSDKLEVRDFFGLIKKFYRYDDLRISETVKGIFIETSSGDQLCLGEKQFLNYDELKEVLEERIQKEQLRVKYTTRFSRIMFGLMVLGIILFIIGTKLR